MVKENIPEYSVTEISKSIKQVLDDTFGYVRVRGEISGLKQAASGHVYLNLKDENAIINGIIWKSNVSRLSFQPHDGLEVICKGRLTTGYSDRYPGRSDYSIHIDSLMPAGEGALMALLEQRKKKFAASGLFDQIHKKQIPEYPHRIGVITSPTGAVIQDILHRIEERYPLNVILWPVPVQGDDSSELITQAIRGFNNIDIESAKSNGVVVTNTPEVLTDCTAEIAMLLLLGVSRRASEGEFHVRKKEWVGWRPTHMMGTKITDKTLGLFGMGLSLIHISEPTRPY